jgi:acyl-CoA thioesterase FadM
VNLNVSYKKTLITPSVVVVRGRVAKKDGRKLQMKGSFEDEKGEKIAEAEGLWIMMGKDVGRSNVGREDVKAKL